MASESPKGSITRWLGPLQEGDPAAVQQLWERYFPRLVGLARVRLRSLSSRMADEEDVALSAFDSFCRNAEQGHFPQLTDRESLWRVLVVITARKAGRLRRDEGRQKRGGAATVMADAVEADADDRLLAQLFSREPTPDLAAQVAEEYQRLLSFLNRPGLIQVAQWRMEGYSVEEIAERLGCAPRSVKRKLQIIRASWEKEMVP
jgi:DNA-directed RNA polymerase specialized sigma24 family protein